MTDVIVRVPLDDVNVKYPDALMEKVPEIPGNAFRAVTIPDEL